MKSAPSGLVGLLAGGAFVFCDLYVFTLVTGEVLRYTTADVDVVYGGHTYSSALFFDQSGNKAVGHWKTGLDVDTWTVYVMPVEVDPVTGAAFPVTIGSVGWLAAVAGGALDGATVDIHRAYWPAWPQPWTSPLPAYSDGSGTYVIVDYFAGRVAGCDLMRNQAVITVNSWLDQFQLSMPRNTWQSSCRHTLFDAGCTLNATSFVGSGIVTTVSNQATFQTNLSQAAGYFSLGRLVWSSGLNAGFARTVRYYYGGGSALGGILLIAPMPFTIQGGDAFTIYPGCDKTLATCTGTFNNAVNFGGQDLIPPPETAI